ncbi:response regulator transcription factor [Trichocoleus sp. FACHB-591]|uniref:response regulator transcription factor n=1 Tax=Trichocoleus sp. FACHB-591 TaxID=2692872 RepID=UPI00168826E3|nr:response regulator transcription factor [Trichocoleus sp. FACHB-591]MBD2094171.1 response regulator transcription factor [Trichocoleus sp. FACHB-591]
MFSKRTSRLLIVEDDFAIRNLLQRFLGRQNYYTEAVADAQTALATFETFNPDLVILDVILPDMLGFNVCERMKRQCSNIPVILLTSLTAVEEQMTGLQWADAYITKPFDLQLLEKQIQAILRLSETSVTPVKSPHLVFDDLIIDPIRREVLRNHQPVPLTALEFDLLYCLAKQPQQAWNREKLIQAVWKHQFVGDGRVVDVHIGQIRKKIEPDLKQPTFIQTVRGFGYKFALNPLKTCEV